MPTPTWDAEPVTPEHVRRAAAICRSTLTPALEEDWSVPAGALTWTCRETLDHVSDALGFYCGQLSTHADSQRPRFRNGDPGATIPALFDAIDSGVAMLGAIATANPPPVRAFHRMGFSDAEGFLAMACEEILVHTWDIAQGLGLTLAAPEDLSRAVLHRIFPWAPTDSSAWESQLWCSDRIALPGKGKIESWGWHGAPIDEWDGQMQPSKVFPKDF
jgi:hypothetical protein